MSQRKHAKSEPEIPPSEVRDMINAKLASLSTDMRRNNAEMVPFAGGDILLAKFRIYLNMLSDFFGFYIDKHEDSWHPVTMKEITGVFFREKSRKKKGESVSELFQNTHVAFELFTRLIDNRYIEFTKRKLYFSDRFVELVREF